MQAMSVDADHADLRFATPSAEVVDVVLGQVVHDVGSSDAVRIRYRLEEDLTMMEPLLVRLRTPGFVSWAMRDGVLLRDIAIAAERLRHTLLLRIVSLQGDNGWVSA